MATCVIKLLKLLKLACPSSSVLRVMSGYDSDMWYLGVLKMFDCKCFN